MYVIKNILRPLQQFKFEEERIVKKISSLIFNTYSTVHAHLALFLFLIYLVEVWPRNIGKRRKKNLTHSFIFGYHVKQYWETMPTVKKKELPIWISTWNSSFKVCTPSAVHSLTDLSHDNSAGVKLYACRIYFLRHKTACILFIRFINVVRFY